MQNLAEPALRLAVKIRPGLTIDIHPGRSVDRIMRANETVRVFGLLLYAAGEQNALSHGFFSTSAYLRANDDEKLRTPQ